MGCSYKPGKKKRKGARLKVVDEAGGGKTEIGNWSCFALNTKIYMQVTTRTNQLEWV
jgi:hypothetical protein